MKTTLNKTAAPAEFPRIMRLRDTARRTTTGKGEIIVLFVSPMIGTVLHADGAMRKIGEHEAYWAPDQFEDYHGTVTLGN